MATSAYSVQELADMTGVSSASIYRELEETGMVLGVAALKIRQRWLLPRKHIDQKLGLEEAS